MFLVVMWFIYLICIFRNLLHVNTRGGTCEVLKPSDSMCSYSCLLADGIVSKTALNGKVKHLPPLIGPYNSCCTGRLRYELKATIQRYRISTETNDLYDEDSSTYLP